MGTRSLIRCYRFGSRCQRVSSDPGQFREDLGAVFPQDDDLFEPQAEHAAEIDGSIEKTFPAARGNSEVPVM